MNRLPSLMLAMCLVSGVLSGCNAPVEASPLPGETDIRETVSTLPISFTPTSIASMTSTAEAPEEGATKVIDGETLIWSEELNNWHKLLNENGEKFPLLDLLKQSNEIGIPDQMWINMFADQSVPGVNDLPSIIHVERVDQQDVPTFNSFLFTNLSNRLGNPEDLFVKINNGEEYLDFFTTAGAYRWKLGPDTDVKVYFRNVSDLSLEEGNGIMEYTDPFDSSNKILVKMYTIDGDLYSEVASLKSLDELSPHQIVGMVLWAPLSIIDGPNQATEQHISEVYRLTNNALDPNFPYFRTVDQ